IAAVGAILIWIAPTITQVAPELRAGVRAVTALLLVSFFLTLVAGVPESVLRGMNLGYRRMGLQASLNVLAGLLTVLAVRAGLGLAGLGGAQVVVAMVTGLLFWLLARRYVHWFGVARPRRADVIPLLSMSAWLTVGEAVAKLLLACDVIILGWVVSPALVTTYVLTGYAARTAIGIHVFAAGAAMPGLGGLIRRGERERARAGAALVTIALAVPFTRLFGAVGLCIGLLGGRAVQSAAYPLLVRGSLGGHRGPLPWREPVRLALVTALLFAAALWIGQRLQT